MTERETSHSIDDAAADWVAREDRARLSPEDAAALEAWLAGDARRPGALLRARAVALHSHAAAALGEGYDPMKFAAVAPPPSRRRLFAWGGGMAASLVLATVVGSSLQARGAHATERGETRLVPLSDGSTALLNTASRLKVRYDARRRGVRLERGEVDFSVVADREDDRPFEVDVGGCLCRSREGAFRLRFLDDDVVDILVHRGRLEVLDRKTGSAPILLSSNTRLALAAGGAHGEPVAPRTVSPDQITRELAWREGRIAFEGEPLAQAAASFARYSETRIVIDDPELAREPITGLFVASDPAGFGHAVAGLFGASVVERGRTIVLGRATAGQ